MNSLPVLVGGTLYSACWVQFKSYNLIIFVGGKVGIAAFYFIPEENVCYLLSERGDSKRSNALLPIFLTNLFAAGKGNAYFDVDESLTTVYCIGGNFHLGTALVHDYAALEYYAKNANLIKDVELWAFENSLFDSAYYSIDFATVKPNVATPYADEYALLASKRFLFVKPSVNYKLPHDLIDRLNLDTTKPSDEIRVVFNLRQHTRTCEFTAAYFEKIIELLQKSYSKVHFYFDGMTSFYGRNLRRRELKWAKNEVDFYLSKVDEINLDFTYDIMVGKNFHDKVIKYGKASVAIMNYGSGFLYPYLLKMPTVMLSSYSHALNRKIINERDMATDQDFPLIVVSPSYPSEEEKAKLPEDVSIINHNLKLLECGLYNENYTVEIDDVISAIESVL